MSMTSLPSTPSDAPLFEEEASVPIFAEEPAEIDIFLDDDGFGQLTNCPHPFRKPIRAIGWIIRHTFGVASLILLLAVLAVIPIVNFFVLGYLLEAEARVARTGKMRYAFHLIDVAPRIGSIVLGCWLWMFPLRLLSGVAGDVAIISPDSNRYFFLQGATYIAASLVGLHLVFALARGGSLGCFFRPLKNVLWFSNQMRAGSYWEQAERHLRSYLHTFRFKHHFLLGLKGFMGAMLWLVPPTLLFASADSSEGVRIVVTIIGGLCLVVVFGWLPFLQSHVAAENRWKAIGNRKVASRIWAHAPIAAFLAVLMTFALALPLYLLKVRLLPEDAMWVATLVYLISIYPARIITGWAYSRGMRPDKPRSRWWLRWSMRLLSFAAIFAFTVLLFFTQDISEHGKLALFEHHAFLLPVPF
ncbi:MAG: hypothetical protein P8M30_05680 [Planctomycetaceae bacterium]|nr:hypothetical protein [Planctomycetaceae bacterium]MDC0274230.1 hypothetical protein [Planctomycetaceae bacterium]MDG2388793.1 hypothetical protein [Planctomycetaceae bacterium]